MEAAAKTNKKKPSLAKRILKWSGFSFLVLLILLIALPLIFQKKIFNAIIAEANKSLTADLSIEDYNLKLISTFPNLVLELKEVKITGRNEFAGVNLINAGTIQAKLNLRSVFTDEIKIERIALKDANIDVRITKEGLANYDITVPDSVQVEDAEPTKFALNLKSYSIENTNINYVDEQGNMRAVITQLNHSGSGDLTQDVVDFETKTSIESTTVFMDGIPYLLGTHVEAVFNLLMENTELGTRITLKENELKLNDFATAYNGWIEMTDDYMDFDLNLDASKSTFASFLSLMPSVYKTGYESMITKGSFELNGYLKGKMTDSDMPGFLFEMLVSDASFSYPDLPSGFKNIFIDVTAKREAGSNLDNTIVDVKKFNIDFLENTIRADFFLTSLMSDPNIKSNVRAKVNLGTLDKVMPMMPGESYKGKLDADMHFNGRMSAIDQERYEDFEARGFLKLLDFEYNSPDFTKPILVHEMDMEFSPRFLAVKNADLEIGNSDLKLDGRVDNYMAYMFRDELLQGDFNLNSKHIDLNDLMGVSAESTSTEEAAPTTSTEDSYVLPSNLDVKLRANVGQLDYDGMTFTNLKGGVGLKESVASLSNVQMNAFGGAMGMDGTYDTRNAKEPKVDFKYRMTEVEVRELTSQFLTIEKLMPIAKHVDGRLSTNFTINSALTSNLDLILESLTGGGDFSMKLLKIGDFEPLNKLSNELRMPELSSQTMRDVAASFFIKDGKINVKPFNLKMDKIKVEKIQGWTSLTQNISYTMTMLVPKEMIPGDIIKRIEQGLGQLGGVAQKLNLGKLPALIPVDVKIGGTVKKPEITTDFEQSIKRLTGNLKDQATELVNQTIDKVKDSVTTIITDKVDEVKSDLIERKNKLMADAQKQADQVKAAAKKQADALRAEADKQANDLVAAAKNPVEKKIAERSAKEIRDQADAKAKKIEDEANKRADQIMKEAQDKADKLQ
jgi:hypothetical protein